MISICIPAYNAAKFLPETLESVARQNYSDWELIVVEDGSDDGTEEIMDSFSSEVKQRVRYLRHNRNKGLPATRNTAINIADSLYIALLDADDLWEPNHLSSVLSEMLQAEADIGHSGSILFDSETGNRIDIRAPNKEELDGFPISLFEHKYIIQPSSVILTRKIWLRVSGFDESFRNVHDREMWLRCARHGAKFIYTHKNTCHYRRHPASLSSNAPQMAINSAKIFDMCMDWEAIPLDLRKKKAADAWFSAARIIQRSQPDKAREFMMHSYHLNRRIKLLLWASFLWLYFRLKGKSISNENI